MDRDTLAVRVARKSVVAEGIAAFELVAADGAALPAFTAGAHVDVHVPGGPVRQYSLCNSPRDNGRYRLAVLREPGSRGGSAGMHDRVSEGDTLTLGAPRNLFPLAEAAQSHLLLAGGIGITPLLSMAWQLAHRGAAFELHYATRSLQRTAFEAELRGAPFADGVHFHFDDGAAAQRLDLPALLAEPVPGRHVYVCGPQGYIEAVLGGARERGWPPAQLHCEYFAASPAATPGERAFDVKLARSGRVVPVAPDRSVVQALAEAGVVVPTSCEQGVCGTCLTRVLEGRPEHRDQYLTEDEQAAGDVFLPCCSRSTSDCLVLDL